MQHVKIIYELNQLIPQIPFYVLTLFYFYFPLCKMLNNKLYKTGYYRL